MGFHVDDTPKTNVMYDKDKYNVIKSATDPIVSLSCSEETFVVSRQSGTVQKYTLPHITVEARMMLKVQPYVTSVNCNGTILSVIDVNGILSFFDMEWQQGGCQGRALETEYKDVWNVKWAEDNPNLVAIMEKAKLIVLKNFQPEEPIISNG